MRIHVNNFTDQPYKLKKRLHISNFSVMTLEQMKHVRPIDPVSTWHLLNENEEDAVEHFNINRDLERRSQLALKQPLPIKQFGLITDASFTAAGYAIKTEDDPNQKYTSVY